MFLSCIWLWDETVSQNWLADATGQLRQLVPLLCECSCLWGLTEAKPALQKSFIIFCLDLLYWLTFLSHFSNISSNFRTVSIFCSLWLFMTSLTSLQFCLYLFICAFHQSSHFTAFFSSLACPCPGLFVRRCYLFDCVPAPVKKFFFSCHPLNFSVWRVKDSCKSCCKS